MRRGDRPAIRELLSQRQARERGVAPAVVVASRSRGVAPAVVVDLTGEDDAAPAPAPAARPAARPARPARGPSVGELRMAARAAAAAAAAGEPAPAPAAAAPAPAAAPAIAPIFRRRPPPAPPPAAPRRPPPPPAAPARRPPPAAAARRLPPGREPARAPLAAALASGARVTRTIGTRPADPLADLLGAKPKKKAKKAPREAPAAPPPPPAPVDRAPEVVAEPDRAPRAAAGAAVVAPPRAGLFAGADTRFRRAVAATCGACGAPACFETESGAACCLLHWFAGGARRGRCRVLSRARIDAQAPQVQALWQRAYAAASDRLGAEAARTLLDQEQHDDPFGALLGGAVPPPGDDDDCVALGDGEGQLRRREEAAAALDQRLCGRKRTAPTLLWATSRDDADRGAAPPAAEEPAGDPCVNCGSTRTEKEPIGGGNVHCGKTETWGSKDLPDSVFLNHCRDCKHTWRTEE